MSQPSAGAGTSAQVGAALLWALGAPGRDGAPDALDTLGASVMAAAEHHGVLPAVAPGLLACSHLGPDPAALRRSLHAVRIGTTARHLRLISQLPRIADALDGLEWAVLKGPVLAHAGYGDPSARAYADLDVLVHVSTFGAAVDHLVAAGAVLLDNNWAFQAAARRAEASLLLPQGIHIDLHWHPVNEHAIRRTTTFDVGAALERRRFLQLNDTTTIPSLDPVDTLLTVGLHAAISGGHRLLWAKDLERLAVNDGADWDQVVRRATDSRLAAPVAIMLQRSRRLLGAAVPTEVLDALARRRTWLRPWLVAEHLARPRTIGRSSHSGRVVVSTLRDDRDESIGALWQAVGMAVRAVVARPHVETASPLRAPAEDASAKQHYLSSAV